MSIEEKNSFITNSFLNTNNQSSKTTYQPYSSSSVYFNKMKNQISPASQMENFRNSFTILSSARKSWDPKRLDEKHEALKKIGAENVKMTTKTGNIIDATFISVDNFLSAIHSLGGKPVRITLDDQVPHFFNEKPIQIDSKIGSCTGLKVDVNQTSHPDVWAEMMMHYESNGFSVLSDENDGGYLIIHQDNRDHLLSEHEPFISETKEIHPDFYQEKQFAKREFEAFYFTNNADKAEEIFKKLKLTKPWIIVKFGNECFITREENVVNLEIAYYGNHSKAPLIIKETLPPTHSSQPTVLLAMNQTSSYEMYTEEMMNLLFLGVNVFAYNDANVGLSKGLNSDEDIYSASEIAVSFLIDEKDIQENEIILKGQCSGFVRLIKTIEMHPDINIWSDQAPINFTDLAKAIYMERINKIKVQMESKPDSSPFIIKMIADLESSERLLQLAKKAVPKERMNEAIQLNQGHKLMTIDVPDADGNGGDELIPEEHVQQFINASSNDSNKLVSLQFIPGGKHVTNWFYSSECYEGVADFLNQTGLQRPLFEIQETDNEQDDEQFVKKVVSALNFFQENAQFGE